MRTHSHLQLRPGQDKAKAVGEKQQHRITHGINKHTINNTVVKCADQKIDVQVEILVCKRAEKQKQIWDEVGSWLDGLFTDGLCTAAAGKML